MSVKPCSYINCDNYVVDNKPSGKFTMFHFPKDEERRKSWMTLGKVKPPLHEISLFMCSEHFDKNYLSINQRRTILVGAALPYPAPETRDVIQEYYEMSDEDQDLELELYRDDALDEIDGSDAQNVQDNFIEEIQKQVDDEENDYQVESTTMQEEDDKYAFHSNILTLCRENPETMKTTNEKHTYKRTISEELRITKGIPPKVIKIGHPRQLQQQQQQKSIIVPSKPIQQQPTKNALSKQTQPAAKTTQSERAAKTEMIVNDEDLIDDNHVSIFVFKGEEHIQMTKEYYMTEKMALVQKLKRYENILRNIRENVNQLNI